jgi:glycosyltransferase involved in cell wall biosynthesis
LMDDWFSVPSLREVAESRVRLASLVVVPTEPLAMRVSEIAPEARVVVLEEPVDIDRLAPRRLPEPSSQPVIVWCGNPYNLKELPNAGAILKEVHSTVPFIFRVVSGQTKPKLDLPIPWEWTAYNYQREASMICDAAAGLAPLEDSTYARSKGTYKIKTYYAAGVPPVASAVGYHCKLIEQGATGFLVSSRDEWVEALLTLLRDPSLAARLKAAAREEAISKYSHSAVIPAWAECLRSHFPALIRA